MSYARMKFYCDEERCIECNGCSVACAEAHELPVGINRRKVVTLNEGIEGKEFSMSIACMHCTDAPCEQVCPVDCFYIREDGIVLHDKDLCIGCGYCLYACPFGAPQFPTDGAFGTRGVMDKCTMCAGGPEETNSAKERELYGQNRIAEGKVPMCAAMCSTKALIVGDEQEVSKIYRERIASKGHGVQSAPYGWSAAYGK
jgi:formate dehydrogenase iron-sulfur subunit